MRRIVAALAALGLSAGAGAHPHSIVEQQALLSLGRGKALITYAIMPSWKDGAHMFGHLDADGNGVLSRGEQMAYARTLLAGTTLTADGAPVRLTVVTLDFPDRKAISAGAGLIKVVVRADVVLPAARRHDVALSVRNHDFGASWFLQPYYFADLTADRSAPKLVRHPGSSDISVLLPAAG